MRPPIGASFIIISLLVSACSKENEVDVSTDIITGVECTSEGDPACGKDGACVLGYCRQPCTADDDCEQGALCIGPGPYGCQLTWDAYCNMSQPCKPGLTCGIDHVCRMPCGTSKACPRSDHECFNNVCVGKTEPGAADTWFACDGVDGRCKDDSTREACNETKPGWVTTECPPDRPLCVVGGTTSGCTAAMDAGAD